MQPSSSARVALSAIVSTFDRAELLGQMLESLCNQTLPSNQFEVVVVDDGSRDTTAEVVRGFGQRLPIRYSYQRNAGLASARNHGLFLARGELALFLDDDDLADPGLLKAHVLAHRRHPEPRIAVLGHTRLAPDLADDPLMHFVTEVGCHLFAYPHLKPRVPLDFTHFWGGRSSCKRSFLLENGVFNPVFRFGCEDIELGYRLSPHWFQVVYEPEAVSTTIRAIDVDGFCRRVERQGRSNLVFSRLHPDKVVQKWTQVEGARERWLRVAAAYEGLLRSARELDRLARLKRAAGVAMRPLELELVHRGYHRAFRASLAKGIVEKAEEEGVPLVPLEQAHSVPAPGSSRDGGATPAAESYSSARGSGLAVS